MSKNRFRDDIEEHEVDTVKVGVVVDCQKLNVREEPKADAEVICTINCGAEVMIDKEGSSNGFYKVCTEFGIEGFCMKQYIEIR